jgi:hypothetical protein
MLKFSKLTLKDINEIKRYFLYSTNKICDNTIGGAFMWRDFFSVEYAEFNDTLIFKAKVKYHHNAIAFSLPLGKDVSGSIKKIVEYCHTTNVPVVFCTATNEDIAMLQNHFEDMQIYQEENWSDYLYKASDLVTLSGRKFSGQRNHINYFKRSYNDYLFEIISDNNVAEVKDFYCLLNQSITKNTDIFAEEQSKTLEVLDNYDTYGLIGGLLRVNNSVKAFAIGEVCRNILFVHIEKADMRYRGIYQTLNNEFAQYYASEDVDFINREEDVGDEGLRISKMSYHPCDIIHKHIVVVK